MTLNKGDLPSHNKLIWALCFYYNCKGGSSYKKYLFEKIDLRYCCFLASLYICNSSIRNNLRCISSSSTGSQQILMTFMSSEFSTFTCCFDSIFLSWIFIFVLGGGVHPAVLGLAVLGVCGSGNSTGVVHV